MRLAGLAACIGLASVAHAQPADVPVVEETSEASLTYHAMPGGLNVASATTLPAGIAVVELTSGVGYRRGLLAENHRFVRATGEVAGAFGVLDLLTLALSFEGYYDRHYGFPSGTLSGCGATCESGWVGKPRVYARFAKPAGPLSFGAQLDLWVPGDTAPSMKLGATSVEARGLVSLSLGRASLSIDAGYHFDNSANSVDDISMLSVPDRVSFGISNYNALVAGALFEQPVGSRARLAAETSVVAFLGDAPRGTAELQEGRWLVRGGLAAELQIVPGWSGVLFVEAIKGPGVLGSQATAGDIPIVPYEPMIAGGIGLASRFGGGGGAAAPPVVRGPPPCWETRAGCPTNEQPLFGELDGTVVDEDGTPVAGATVKVVGTTYGESATVTTKDDGTYTIANVRVGKRLTTPSKGGPKVEDKLDEIELDVRVELTGYESRNAKIGTPRPGTIKTPSVVVAKTLPPGQVRGVVRNVLGKPIANATVTVTPGDVQAASGPDGKFVIDLAPGAYRIRVQAEGFADQELAVTIDANGVALKEFVLR